jgi:2'-5' RNA ligase
MRLFAGVEIDERLREHCVAIQARLQRANFSARYEEREKMHVTLAFLGNVAPLGLHEIERALEAVASATHAFAVRFDRIGAFPNERRPRVVWLGSRAQNPSFRALAQTLRAAYRELGFAFDEDPVAHVTLARVKGGAPRPVPALELEAAELQIASLTLFESLPDTTTTRYAVRRTASLLPFR